MTLDELLNLVSLDNGPHIRIDSRLVRQGDVFVAVEGTACDGHDFIDQAVANGAKYVVCQSAPSPAQAFPRPFDSAQGMPGSTLLTTGRSGQARPCFHGLEARATPAELIIVKDSAEAAGLLSMAAAGNPAAQLTNLAVTGTNGKTTVAFLVRSIIQNAGHKCGLIGTVTYDTCAGRGHDAPLTTPDCLTIAEMAAEMVKNGAEYMAIEASSHALSQNRLAGLKFKAAAFTNLTGDHLDYHKTEEDYLAAKTRLFEALRPDATAVLNRQSPHAGVIAGQTRAGILWYAIDDQAGREKADVTAHIESMNTGGTTFAIEHAGQRQRVKSPLLGRHNVSNSLAAAGLCLAAGFDIETVARGLSAPQAIPGRLEKVDRPALGGKGGEFTVLIDYAHTDDALKNVLSTLKPLCRGRLILVFGCGGDRDRTKRPRMARVAEQLADLVIVTSDNPRTEKPEDIINEITVGFESGAAIPAAALRETSDEARETRDEPRSSPPCVAGFAGQGSTKIVEPDRRKAIELAIELAANDDIVLIAGKGHETYQIIGKQKFDFSDKKVAQECLGNSG